MKIYNQWRFGEIWGISLFTVFGSNDFVGIVLFGIVVEFPRTAVGHRIHELSDSDESWQASEALLKR